MRTIFPLLIIVLLITLSLTVAEESTNEETENSYVKHDTIFINGNLNFTSANGVSSGDGSKDNPYIIENWNISADKKNGIEIRNTTAYFIIRNVYISEGIRWGGKELPYSGTYLDNVSNGRIENSTLINNDRGIYFQNSSNNKIINTNLLENDYSIYFYYSNNNQIINTNINGSYGIHIYLYSSINILIENSTMWNSHWQDFYLVSNSSAITINTTFSKPGIYPPQKVYMCYDSILTIKNYLHVKVLDKNNKSIENAIVSIKDNGKQIFNGKTNKNGEISFILITDRIYIRGNKSSSDIIFNETEVYVSYDSFTFTKNPRYIEMDYSHQEVFQSNEELKINEEKGFDFLWLGIGIIIAIIILIGFIAYFYYRKNKT